MSESATPSKELVLRKEEPSTAAGLDESLAEAAIRAANGGGEEHEQDAPEAEAEAHAKPKPSRGRGRRKAASSGSTKKATGRGRGRGRGRAAAPARPAAQTERKPSKGRGDGPDADAATEANRLLHAAGKPPSQNVSAHEASLVRKVVGGTDKAGIVKMLGFKTEKALRAYVSGEVEQPDDKKALGEFVGKVKHLHPSPRIRPRKVAATALALVTKGGSK